MRVIKISNCRECPHLDHKGAFGKVAYIPRCGLSGRELPYTEVEIKGSRQTTSYSTYEIPENCPLEKE